MEGPPIATKKRIPFEYTGAFKHGHRRSVQEYIDDDFSFKLLNRARAGDEKARDALLWLTKYNNEYYRGVLKKNDKDAIHNTDELYRDATNAHNARRRDITCLLKSGQFGADSLTDTETATDTYLNQNRNLFNHEDSMIELFSAEDEPLDF